MSNIFTLNDPSNLWELIEVARQDYQQFLELIESMDQNDLGEFCQKYQETAYDLYAEKFLPYLNPNLSEDSLEDLLKWIVAQGRDYYEKIYEIPSSLPQNIDRNIPTPKILKDAFSVYLKRFGTMPPFPYEA